ncbi:hypothetical protein EJB05_36284, partial [Eragrostis curvula]
MSHIAVERNRRRQMNEHLKVLRSLTPALYIKRGDQASIIGGAIDFIRELQQVLESLEARKKRRRSSGASSFSGGGSPTPSPRSLLTTGSSSSDAVVSPASIAKVKELAACCNSPVADVEAKISGSNVPAPHALRPRPRPGAQDDRRARGATPGGAPPQHQHHGGHRAPFLRPQGKSITDEPCMHIYTYATTILSRIGIGLECQVSVEDLAYEVQQTFACCHQELDQQQDNLIMYPSAMPMAI